MKNPNNEDWDDTEAVLEKIRCGLSPLQLPQLDLDLYKVSNQQPFQLNNKKQNKNKKTQENTSWVACVNVNKCIWASKVFGSPVLQRILPEER